MNFPMDEPIFQFLFWMMNTPGLGGLVVAMIVTTVVAICTRTLLWIVQGAKVVEAETYAYPTPALHFHSRDGAR